MFYSRSNDPYENLAAEELLLKNHEGAPALYLWQNDSTVVIGKHQNPYAECNLSLLEESGAHLARRLSGGGAVYHDMGNLNFTFVMKRSDYDLSRQTEVLLRAVRRVGIDAVKTGRNDLTADSRKFSGNAYCMQGENAYHHGTLLVGTDLERMDGLLTADAAKIRSKGVASVRARVVNLSQLRHGLEVGDLADALRCEFCAEYGASDGRVCVQERFDLSELREKYASWDFRFGKTPVFDIRVKERAAWGGFELLLKLRDGRVESAAVYTDAMDESLADRIREALTGCRLEREELGARLEGFPPEILRCLGEFE